MTSSPSRSYCFTLHVRDEDSGYSVSLEEGEEPDEAYRESFAEAYAEGVMRDIGASNGTRYCIGQLERCPDTGRLHIQGYVECKSPQRLKWLKGR